MDGLEEGDVVVEDEVDTSPLLCGTLAYICVYGMERSSGRKGREVGWEFAREFRNMFLSSKLQTYLHHL